MPHIRVNSKLVALGAAILGGIIGLGYISIRGDRGCGNEQCPVTIACAAYRGGVGIEITVCGARSGDRVVATWPGQNRPIRLLGYLRNEDAWLLSEIDVSGDYRLVRLNSETTSSLSLSGLPREADLGDVVMRGQRLYVPYSSGGKIVLACYTANGAMLWRRPLVPPSDSDGVPCSYVDVSPGGLAVLAFERQTDNQAQVYVYGKDGHGIYLGDGNWPVFDADGHRVVFTTHTDDGRNVATICHLTSKADRCAVADNRPCTMPRTVSQKRLAGPSGKLLQCKWDPAGNRLVCSIWQELTGNGTLHCSDLNDKRLRWSSLSVSAETDHWIVLDKPVATAR